jgi:hypothetical protein
VNISFHWIYSVFRLTCKSDTTILTQDKTHLSCLLVTETVVVINRHSWVHIQYGCPSSSSDTCDVTDTMDTDTLPPDPIVSLSVMWTWRTESGEVVIPGLNDVCLCLRCLVCLQKIKRHTSRTPSWIHMNNHFTTEMKWNEMKGLRLQMKWNEIIKWN